MTEKANVQRETELILSAVSAHVSRQRQAVAEAVRESEAEAAALRRELVESQRRRSELEQKVEALEQVAEQNKTMFAATVRATQLLPAAGGADPKLIAMGRLHVLGEVLSALFGRLHERDGSQRDKEEEMMAELNALRIAAASRAATPVSPVEDAFSQYFTQDAAHVLLDAAPDGMPAP